MDTSARRRHSSSHRSVSAPICNADEATDTNYTNAVVRAVQLGINVIDSAANYRFQRSERSIGQALKILANDHGIQRDELVICTKGGYLARWSAAARCTRVCESDFVKPGIASFEDIVGGSHCMTPSYLQNQPDQSLRNMDLECVDVYYIHNPESQLGHVSSRSFMNGWGLRLNGRRKSQAGQARVLWRGNVEWFSCSPGFRWSSLARTHVRDRD